MTVAEALQVAIDNEKSEKVKSVYRKWYGQMTIKQASAPLTEKERKNWLERHYPNAVASYGA